MSEQIIQCQDIKVADTFQSFYIVPDYQREYVWEPERVEKLLTDIYYESEGVDAPNAPEYFIGSIVVCPGSHGVLDLIDGRQRPPGELDPLITPPWRDGGPRNRSERESRHLSRQNGVTFGTGRASQIIGWTPA
jgi:hypothetical protein